MKKFLRDYISQTDEYNEHLITANLLSLENYSPPMLILQFEQLSFTAEPVFPEVLEIDETSRHHSLAKRILDFVKSNDNGSSKRLKLADIEEISGIKTKLTFRGLQFKLRDLPLQIAGIEFLYFDLAMLNLRYVVSFDTRTTMCCFLLLKKYLAIPLSTIH